MIVNRRPEKADAYHAAGAMRCPRRRGSVAKWGSGRARTVRSPGTVTVTVHPQRVRCHSHRVAQRPAGSPRRHHRGDRKCIPRHAPAATLTPLPEHLRRSVTWDRGRELARHAELTASTGIRVYFCDPYSQWQRGTNENTNGLLRQYFPNGTDLSRYGRRELYAVADALNNRPRKIHRWNSPAEVFAEQLHSPPRHSVATTG